MANINLSLFVAQAITFLKLNSLILLFIKIARDIFHFKRTAFQRLFLIKNYRSDFLELPPTPKEKKIIKIIWI